MRSLVRALLPAPLARRAQELRVRRERHAFRDRVVSHRYGGRTYEIQLSSLYGERYDQDWPELVEIAALKQHGLVAGARVFNLGANHGVIALMLADAVGSEGQVIALEADPDDAAAATSNAARNSVAQLTVMNAAVAREDGSLEFGLRGAVAHGDAKAARRRVPAVSIDGLASRFGAPDVVFMDVEGYEAEALAGAGATLARGADWFVEVHAAEDLERFDARARDVLDFFDQGRYELWAARDGLHYDATRELVSATRFQRLDRGFKPPRERFFLLALRSTAGAADRKLGGPDAV